MGDRIVVFSSERDAQPLQVEKCIQSVSMQTEPHVHRFVDDGSFGETFCAAFDAWRGTLNPRRQDGSLFKSHPREAGRCALQNLYEAVHELEDSAIVCWVDGDDWLAHDRALERVRAEYDRTDREVWMTWGQFQFASGSDGWASDYSAAIKLSGHVRWDIWRATHLKTFRAGLFKRIRKLDLMRCVGQVEVMTKHGDKGHQCEGLDWTWWAIDLAVMFPMLEMARERGSFIPEVLYTYSGENGGGTGPGTPTWAEAERIRGMSPYSRLEERPW